MCLRILSSISMHVCVHIFFCFWWTCKKSGTDLHTHRYWQNIRIRDLLLFGWCLSWICWLCTMLQTTLINRNIKTKNKTQGKCWQNIFGCVKNQGFSLATDPEQPFKLLAGVDIKNFFAFSSCKLSPRPWLVTSSGRRVLDPSLLFRFIVGFPDYAEEIYSLQNDDRKKWKKKKQQNQTNEANITSNEKFFFLLPVAPHMTEMYRKTRA